MSRRTGLLLAAIVIVGLGARVGYLLHATSQPRYSWDDPDHYSVKADKLANGSTGWRWSFDVVRHSSYDHRVYMLPPGYPVFLSLFASFPGYPFSAQMGQALLSTVTILMLFLLGREIHSTRAGLVAAGIYALWLPNIIAVWSTMQESLYIPLVTMALALLLRGAREESRAWVLGTAGLVFGIATLTRSMPLYAMPLFAFVLLLRPTVARRKRLVGIATLATGFLAATLPYSVLLSAHLSRPTFVENHGSIFIIERYGGLEGDDPATLPETVGILTRAFYEDPLGRTLDLWTTTKSVLHVNGGRLLQIYLGASTRLGAAASRVATLAFADGSFVLCLLAAPFGLFLCRRRDLAMFLVVWVLVTLGLTALSFGGPRLRAPIEPSLIALAAVFFAGGFRAPGWRGLACALGISLVSASVVLPQLPRSARARADYGVHWPMTNPPKRSRMVGDAGFNLMARDDALRFHVRTRNPAGVTLVEVRIDGVEVERMRLGDQEHRFELPAGGFPIVHVELSAVDASTNEPVPLLVIVPGRAS